MSKETDLCCMCNLVCVCVVNMGSDCDIVCRIGLAIAQHLARNGARVMVSSRREDHVKHAVDALKGEGLSVEGTICHVGKEEHRKQLIQEVGQQGVLE